jgi:hypothetical protein
MFWFGGEPMLDLNLPAVGLSVFALLAAYIVDCERV